jgi:hypothetical protein
MNSSVTYDLIANAPRKEGKEQRTGHWQGRAGQGKQGRAGLPGNSILPHWLMREEERNTSPKLKLRYIFHYFSVSFSSSSLHFVSE